MVLIVANSVPSSSVADLPAVLRFLLQHANAANVAQITSAIRFGVSIEMLAGPPARAEVRSRGGFTLVGGGVAASETLVLDAVQVHLPI